ncbi:hypothetical protein PD280_06325 [Virgibacillus salarius]|uniref:hypothetical protein n=1 Tax=Virgibacillus salarius TaxID=447199 RepID=UPI002491EA04|nr:hypothetical protein [Virgibacillus salarius]WBX81334.1 hypothetical protein PD280_06325 [Virgibacillus salarius]
MKKIFFVLMFFVVIIGCESNETLKEESNTNDEEIEDKQDEMLESAILSYMEQMTGKYLMVDTYETGSKEQQKALDKALTDVNIAVLDIEDKYDSNLPVVKELNNLAESVSFAINELIAGEYSTKVDNSEKVGTYVGEISRNYLDGELPPSVKVHTGMESAFD